MDKAFYERFWQDKIGGKLPDFEMKWPVLREFIPTEGALSILDFGCGNGEILSQIRALNPQARCTGVDVSRSAVDVAKARYPWGAFHQIRDGGPLPLGTGSVDFIFTSEVIEHVYDTDNAFNELARVLKPGGRMLMTCPYHGLIKNLLVAAVKFERHYAPNDPHVRFFTKRTLASCLASRGLEVVRMEAYGRFWPVWTNMYAYSVKPAAAQIEVLAHAG